MKRPSRRGIASHGLSDRVPAVQIRPRFHKKWGCAGDGWISIQQSRSRTLEVAPQPQDYDPRIQNVPTDMSTRILIQNAHLQINGVQAIVFLNIPAAQYGPRRQRRQLPAQPNLDYELETLLPNQLHEAKVNVKSLEGYSQR